MNFSPDDHQFMTQALRLAERGLYTTMPNPRVGCVIVKNGQIIGSGWTQPAGQDHAEIQALKNCNTDPRGADVYVTLEPCSHFGRTPPCCDALINAGVKRVVAAMQDPNPLVAGSGLARLAASGMVVTNGLLQEQAHALNSGFISRMTRGIPWVRTKIAASLDGRTALANGVSQWITGAEARRDVQHWRASACAILTGAGTVLADDPQMNVREFDIGRQPLRVVVDNHLRISPKAKIVQGGNTLIAYAQDPHNNSPALQAAGAELIQFNSTENRVYLPTLLKQLAQRGINELLVEAGQGLNGALLEQGLIDEFLLYYAPLLLGSEAKAMFAMPPLTAMSQRCNLTIFDLRQIGRDIRIRAKPDRS